MTPDRIKETYRRHTIVAALHDGAIKGRVYKNKQVIYESGGDSVESIVDTIKKFIDDSIVGAASNRDKPPDGEEYVNAFRNVVNELTGGHCAMLKAHYHAENQTLTTSQLAEAAGYSSYSAVNLQYGMVANALNEELPIELPTRSDGTPIATFALATAGNREGSEDQWTWKLRPEVAFAIEILGLHV